jgi:hypothetical protein
MTTSYTLKSYILPGSVSYRDGNAIAVRVELDTGNQGRTMITREKAMMLVRPEIVRKHEITYMTANGTPMFSSGSIELNIVILFDAINNDYESVKNLRFDIVDDLHIPNKRIWGSQKKMMILMRHCR